MQLTQKRPRMQLHLSCDGFIRDEPGSYSEHELRHNDQSLEICFLDLEKGRFGKNRKTQCCPIYQGSTTWCNKEAANGHDKEPVIKREPFPSNNVFVCVSLEHMISRPVHCNRPHEVHVRSQLMSSIQKMSEK